MRASLPLLLSLHRRQRAAIQAALEPPSPTFRAYQARYRRHTSTYASPLTRAAVYAEAAAADVVYVGDYHTLRTSQDAYRELVAAVLPAGRRLVLALEFIEGRQQPLLEAYLHGTVSERELLSKLGHPEAGFSLWPGFHAVLQLARAKKLEVVAIDRRATGSRSLALRDRYAARQIAAAAAAEDRPLVLVLMGQYHVAPCHLPAQVRLALRGVERRHLVVYQNAEGAYWKLLADGHAGVEAAKLREGELALFNASPVLSQQSFLDHVEAQAGDAPIPPGGVDYAFRKLATLLGRQLGVDVKAALARVHVAKAGDADLLERLAGSGPAVEDAELARFRQRVLARESCYLPSRHFAYIASLSLSHVAEEAAHFVRHCAVGEAMERPRGRIGTFYARAIEEAIGFLGSRLIHPTRRCPALTEHARTFQEARGRARSISAHVLAHKAAEAEGASPEALAGLVPGRDVVVFDGVSHALGYLLGDALDRAFRDGRLGIAAIKALFRDALEAPQETYLALWRAALPARRKPSSGALQRAVS